MRLRVLLSAAFLTALALPTMGFAQDVVRCSSDDMRRHYCNVGQNSEIRFARQASESRCIPGRTYGIERDRIWVDRGCRADFQVFRQARSGPGNSDWGHSHNPKWDRDRDRDRDYDRDDNRGGYGYRSGQTMSLTCSSEDGYHSCPTDGEIMQARVVRQRSGSACTQGRSWGYSGSTLWVDHGCRADFELTLRGQGGRGGFGGFGRRGRTYTMKCDSNDEGHHTCSAEGEVIRARLVHQNSGSPCVQGRSWGYTRDGLWVDRGCRAEFEVTTR